MQLTTALMEQYLPKNTYAWFFDDTCGYILADAIDSVLAFEQDDYIDTIASELGVGRFAEPEEWESKVIANKYTILSILLMNNRFSVFPDNWSFELGEVLVIESCIHYIKPLPEQVDTTNYSVLTRVDADYINADDWEDGSYAFVTLEEGQNAIIRY